MWRLFGNMEKNLEKLMKHCRLCPRNCGADRLSGGKGYCREPAQIYAARAALHMWEEPCISGTEGSGAVFFSGCNLRCIFCQNAEISRGERGKEVTIERLAEIFLELQEQKANNINLVTPTHFVPLIITALTLAKGWGLKIPVVYNCGGYEKPETLRLLEGVVDIWLPDFKYEDTHLAAELSGAPDYPERAKEALGEMVRQQPEAVFDERGIMKRGVIVRHLVLPGHLMNSRKVLRYLWEVYGDKIYISLLKQYTPLHRFADHPELERKLTKREYDKILEYALQLGFSQGFMQEGGTAKESFIPAFDDTGIEGKAFAAPFL